MTRRIFRLTNEDDMEDFPKSFEAMHDWLTEGGSTEAPKGKVKIAHGTYVRLSRSAALPALIELTLHADGILLYWANGDIVARTGPWPTDATVRRLNAATPDHHRFRMVGDNHIRHHRSAAEEPYYAQYLNETRWAEIEVGKDGK